MAKDVFDIEIQPGQPAYRQITDILRGKIQSEVIVPGTKLPIIGKLAKKWNTNYFTVQTALSTLANEGLIESTPRSGTFVRSSKIRCTSIGLYFGSNFSRTYADGFYTVLFGILCERLAELNIRPQFWIDHRPPSEQYTPLSALLKAVEKREIQGVIASMVTGEDVKWLKELPVPISLAWNESDPATVTNDLHQMVVVSLRRFRELNCKTVGLITNHAKLGTMFEEEAKKLKLVTTRDWIRLSETEEVSEVEGATVFKQLWSQETHPEGLLVFPDVMARGAMISMFEKQVRIPEDLRVIFHLNAELVFHCPLQVDWIVSHVIRIADGLISSIQKQVSGAPPTKLMIPLELRSVTNLPR